MEDIRDLSVFRDTLPKVYDACWQRANEIAIVLEELNFEMVTEISKAEYSITFYPDKVDMTLEFLFLDGQGIVDVSYLQNEN